MSRNRPVSGTARERLRRQTASAQRPEPAPTSVAASRREAAKICAWCGGLIAVKATGRIPTWCSQSCRQRAWEQKRAAESGRCAVQVVERVVTAPTPSDGTERRDWPALIEELARELDRGRIYRRDFSALADALEHIRSAYRRANR